MCLDIICPRWSLNLAHYIALMSWCINWLRIEPCIESSVCLYVQRACEEEGKLWLENLGHIFFLCCLQRLVSVLNLDSVQNEGRIGIICSFVQATICVHSETPFFQDFQEIRNMLASPTIAYKAPVLKSRKASLQKHYIFGRAFSVCWPSNLNIWTVSLTFLSS